MLKEPLQTGNREGKALPTENKLQTTKEALIGSYILVITLNVNGVKAPAQRQTGWRVKHLRACTSTHRLSLLDPPPPLYVIILCC